MKKTYRIGEVGKLLGLSIDAIRFYEKKGLVHPTSNVKNQYREYDNSNILELLDIIYYRHLDISIADIQEIIKHGTKEGMRELLQAKRLKTEKHILYEQQLIKKITYLESISEDIDNRRNRCYVGKFPASYLLSRSDKAQDVIVQQLSNLSEDEFVLCSLIHTYGVQDMEVKESMLTIEKAIVEELNIEVEPDAICLGEQDCLYMLTNMLHKNIQKSDVEPMLTYAKEHQLSYMDILYVKELPLTSYADTDNYYAELCLPIHK